MVDLRSDTQTRPTEAMRAAMARAEVGDEQRFEDPTVLALQERVADLLGHQAAVFLPSGTMCNAIAFRLHLRPGGDEALVGQAAHPLRFEAGGPAVLSGAMVRAIGPADGRFTGDEVRAAAFDPADRYAPRTRLVSVEQTTNVGGGRVWPLAQVESVLGAAAELGLRTHLDGARLMNAVVASEVPASAYAEGFDTAWVDFSKGLGAPVGACLAGSSELIQEAWRFKQMWGGAMRQSGIVAAGALYALDHHVERLAEDHVNAHVLAEGLADVAGVEVDPAAVETNIVVFAVPDAPRLVAELAAREVLMGALDARHVRAVTHLDVDLPRVERAVVAVHDVLTSW
jgi:threonine aldolase